MPLPNVDSPRGFSLFQKGGKTEPTRRERPFESNTDDNSKNLAIGDAYTLNANGNAVRVQSNADDVFGVVEGIRFQQIDDQHVTESKDILLAGVAGFVIGIEDVDAFFRVQIDDSTGVIAASALEVVDADDNLPLRQSRQSVKVGNDQFRFVALVDSPADNSDGAFAQIIVRLTQTV